MKSGKMKFQILAAMILTSVIISSAQQKAENDVIVIQDGNGIQTENTVIPVEMIQSITHDVSDINTIANFNSKYGQYSVEIVNDRTVFDVVPFSSISSRWLKLSSEVKEDWDAAIVNNKGLLVFLKQTESLDYVYCVSEPLNPESENNWIFLALTKDNRAAEFFSCDFYGMVSLDDNDDAQVLLCKSGEVVYEFEMKAKSPGKEIQNASGNSLSYGSVVDVLNSIQHEYFPEKPNIQTSFNGLTESIPNYINPLFDKVEIQSLENLEKSTCEYRNSIFKELYGNCNIAILDACNNEDDFYDYNLKVEVSGIESIRKNECNGKPISLYYGAVVKKDGKPDWNDYNIRKADLLPPGDIDNSIALGELDVSSSYSAIPYLMPKACMKYYSHINSSSAPAVNPVSCIKFGAEYAIVTHTPEIKIGPTTVITCNAVEIPFSISFSPKNADISVLMTGDDGINNTINLTGESLTSPIKFTDLTPGSKYTCSATLAYKDFSVTDECEFTTSAPSVSLLEAFDITQDSAKISYNINDNIEGAKYELVYTDGDTAETVNLSADASEVNLTNLIAITEYTCYVKILYQGREWTSGELKFETNVPNLSGTWTCIEKHWQSTTNTYRETTSTITLYPDGTVTYSKGSREPVSCSWQYSKDGQLSINIMDLANQNYNHGIIWSLKTKTPRDPQLFEGTFYNWNWNQVIGYHQSDSIPCSLTRQKEE